MRRWCSGPFILFVVIACLMSIAACGSDKGGNGFGSGGGSGSGGSGSGGNSGTFGTSSGGASSSGGTVSACPPGLQCNVQCSSGGATTTISGKVYDPAGKNPLYNVAVYVPVTPLQALPKGVPTGADACSCSASLQERRIWSALLRLSMAHIKLEQRSRWRNEMCRWSFKSGSGVGNTQSMLRPARTTRSLTRR